MGRRSLPDHNGSELATEELSIQRAALQGREVRDPDVEVVCGEERRHLVGNAKPLLDEQGNVRGASGTFMDVTGRRRAEEAGQDLLRQLGSPRRRNAAASSGTFAGSWRSGTRT